MATTGCPLGLPLLHRFFSEQLLQGLNGIAVYIDDIWIKGKTSEEHLQKLDIKLEEVGIQLKHDKCFFQLLSVEHLGHKVSSADL